MTKETDEKMLKISNSLKSSGIMKSKHHSKDAKEKISEASKRCWQRPEYRKQILKVIKKNWENPVYKKLMSVSAKKQWEDPEYQEFRKQCCNKQWQDSKFRKKMSKVHKKLWRNLDYRGKVIRGMIRAVHSKPNKKELELGNLLQQNQLPYEFVGDGKIIINGCNPDFINTNGQEKIIELYGNYWHRDEKTENDGDNGKRRKEIFAHFGYQTLIIWEDELADKERLLKKVLKF